MTSCSPFAVLASAPPRCCCELGDLSRFATVRDLVAYVGLSPHLHRSGSSVQGPSPLSKHGHASIRHALYFPAMSAARHNPAIQYSINACSPAASRKCRAVAAMRKLVHQIYGVLRSGQVFDPAHVSRVPSGKPPLPRAEWSCSPIHLTPVPCLPSLLARSLRHHALFSVLFLSCACSFPPLPRLGTHTLDI